MANPFCLIPQYADAFLAKVKSGELNPDALVRMTSDERRAAFAEVMGEANAAHVNASFESKLLLRNQQAGIARWIEKAKDLTPQAKRDLLARVERMDAVLDPQNGTPFLADLAKQRLGFGVTMEEAGKITALAKRTADARQALEAGGDRMDYGRARVAFGNYVADLKNGAATGVEKALRTAIAPGQTPLGRLRAAGTASVEAAKNVPGFAKSFKAAFDNSALLRQGWKNLFAHPEVWSRNALKSFRDLAQQFGGKAVMDEVNADIASRPNALNGRYAKAKLALGVVEEAYPTTLPEKIPLIGRIYKASEAAFTAFQYRSRADVFDKYMEIAEKSGVDLAEPGQLESIGRLVNSLTSRGHLGPLEPSANALNVAFFSARKLKADFDFLTAHSLDEGVTPFVRKQAAINLVKVVSGTAAILAVAKAVAPESVDWDPRSANFGKIKVGHTRFDVTGGMASILTLAARMATLSSKSTTTGEVTPLNSGKFGSTTGTDLVYNFFENKLSPAASIVKDLLKGKDFAGNKPTVKGELSNLFMPLPITNAQELAADPKSAGVVLGMLADMLGVSANTWTTKASTNPTVAQEYERLRVPWSSPSASSSVQGRTFTRSDDQQKQYAQQVEQATSDYLARYIASPAYQRLSDNQKQYALMQIPKKVHAYYSKQAATTAARAGQTPTKLSPRTLLRAGKSPLP